MSKYLHNIKVKLYKNLLTDDPNDYCARTKTEHVYGIEDISYLAETRGGSNIKADDMTRIVKQWFKEMTYQLCDANAINTGYFQAKLHVQGVFHSITDNFDPQRHKLLFEFQQGKLLRDELSLAGIEIDGAADTSPLIDTVYDYSSDTTNQQLICGGVVDIKGFNLKFLQEQNDNGIWLVDAANGNAYKVDTIVTNTPQHLIAQIPLVSAGNYWLEVRTTYAANGKPLKTLKVGRLSVALAVAGNSAE